MLNQPVGGFLIGRYCFSWCLGLLHFGVGSATFLAFRSVFVDC